MSRWTDPRVREFAVRGWGTPTALAKALRQLKRSEAAVRNAATRPERRRAARQEAWHIHQQRGGAER